MLRTRSAGAVLAVGLLYLSQVNASSITPTVFLDFNSLPSAQGWVYDDRGGGILETDVFSVNGTTLNQNTMGHPESAWTLYSLPNAVNSLQPFTFQIRARVLDHDTSKAWPFGFDFGVDTGNERILIGLTPIYIAASDGFTFGYTVSSSIDNTQFHNYRLEGTPGVGWELFVDDNFIGSGAFGGSDANRVLFGDGTPSAKAEAEIAQLTFTQIPEPTTFTLVGLGSLALVLVRRRR